MTEAKVGDDGFPPITPFGNMVPKRIRPPLWLSELLVDAVAAGAGAMTATGVVHPMDTVKTRVQASKLQGIQALKAAVNVQSPVGLYAGVKPVVIGSTLASAVKFALYQTITRAVASTSRGYTNLARAGTAIVCSLFSSLVFVPLEGVKQRMQTTVGGGGSLRLALANTWRDHGLRGVYRGWGATLSRDIPFTTIELVTYDILKTAFRERIGGRELRAHESLTIGGVAGAIAGAMTCPVDVIKTRLMTQTTAANSVVACVQAIVREEGIPALFRGVWPRIVIITPMTAIFFAVFESSRIRMRKALNIPIPAASH